MYLMLDEFTSKSKRRKRHASISFRITSALINCSKECTETINSFPRVTQRKSWQSLQMLPGLGNFYVMSVAAECRNSLLLQPTSVNPLIVRYAFSSADKIIKILSLIVLVNLLLSYTYCLWRIQ